LRRQRLLGSKDATAAEGIHLQGEIALFAKQAETVADFPGNLHVRRGLDGGRGGGRDNLCLCVRRAIALQSVAIVNETAKSLALSGRRMARVMLVLKPMDEAKMWEVRGT
jgi:hypothetical protein